MNAKEIVVKSDLNKRVDREWRRAQLTDLAKSIFSWRRIPLFVPPVALAACAPSPAPEVRTQEPTMPPFTPTSTEPTPTITPIHLSPAPTKILLDPYTPTPEQVQPTEAPPATEAKQNTLFKLDLTTPRTIIEGERNDSQWWLTSGGAVMIENGILRTPQRETTTSDPWNFANAGDEDAVKAKRPQIVQRSITAEKESDTWSNYYVTTTITPTENIVSESPEVDGTDGIDLFLYFNPNEHNGSLWYNTYISYITKDGRIIIKKRYVDQDGNVFYGLLNEQKVIEGQYQKGQSLIPIGIPITLRATIQNAANATDISFEVEIPATGSFKGLRTSISGVDDGSIKDQESETPLGKPYQSGRAGLRTDSLEFLLSDFTVATLATDVTTTP